MLGVMLIKDADVKVVGLCSYKIQMVRVLGCAYRRYGS
jgi:hypothetical protein